MRQLVSLLSISILLSSCSVSTELKLQESDLSGIRSNFKKQEICWNNGDMEAFVEAYYPSENVQTISKTGIITGVKNILHSYQEHFPKVQMGKLYFDNFTYKKLNQQYVYVVGRFNLEREGLELKQGWFSIIMEKIDGKWYMISDHSSS